MKLICPLKNGYQLLIISNCLIYNNLHHHRIPKPISVVSIHTKTQKKQIASYLGMSNGTLCRLLSAKQKIDTGKSIDFYQAIVLSKPPYLQTSNPSLFDFGGISEGLGVIMRGIINTFAVVNQ